MTRRDAKRERIEDLQRLLLAAKRYVDAHAGDGHNHPQSREAAGDLARQINLATE